MPSRWAALGGQLGGAGGNLLGVWLGSKLKAKRDTAAYEDFKKMSSQEKSEYLQYKMGQNPNPLAQLAQALSPQGGQSGGQVGGFEKMQDVGENALNTGDPYQIGMRVLTPNGEITLSDPSDVEVARANKFKIVGGM